jgi:hypothetical protein
MVTDWFGMVTDYYELASGLELIVLNDIKISKKPFKGGVLMVLMRRICYFE